MTLYDQFDENGTRVISKMTLVPGLSLPEGHRWELHVPTLEDLKLEKLEEILFQRNLARYAPIVALGHTWQADSNTQTILSQAILLAQVGIPAPTIWRDLDNNNVEVTLDDLKLLAASMAYSTQQAYVKSWALKASVDAATTPEEIASITW